MEKKWNLQDIKPSGAKRRRPDAMKARPTVSAATEAPRVEPTFGRQSKKRGGFVLAVLVFLIIAGGGFLFSFLLGGAEVTVYPRHREPTVNSVFTAYKEAPAGELAYEIMTLEAEGERQVKATGEEQVATQATGDIVIYKTTTGSERLIKNTRFESSGGLIFRVTESVVVPGATKDAGGNTVPGKVTAKVFADVTGDKYNLPENTKFTVPGFKEGGFDELYSAISATNEVAFSGGYEGLRFTVDEAELGSAKTSLETELRQALESRVANEKPANFVVFDSAIVFSFESLPPTESSDGQAVIKEKAKLQIPIFRDSELASYLAKATIPGYEGESVRIDDISKLSFAYSEATTTEASLDSRDKIAFQLTGAPRIVWTFDQERLKNDLLGASKTALTAILGAYPAIERAEAVVRPFWKRSFPDKIEDINIKESLEEQAG